MTRLVYDTETNGLLDQLDRIHCLSIRDVETEEEWSFADHRQTHSYPDIPEGLAMLSEADEIIAHNGIGFDLPAILKCYPQFSFKKHGDTLVVSRAAFSNLKEKDFQAFRQQKFPPHLLMKTNSLEAWGHRLGFRKADYDGGWDHWSPVMHDYMRQDTVVLLKLQQHIDSKKVPQMVIDTEIEVAFWLEEQKRNGFMLDVKRGVELYAQIQPKHMEIEQKMKATFGCWYKAKGKEKVQKRTTQYSREHLPEGVKETFFEGAVFQPVEQVEFNPSSRQHISKVLIDKYDWHPMEFTDAGVPKVTDDIVGALNYPEAPLITEYLMLDKRVGQLYTGKQAWLKLVDSEGFIHGSVNQSGAVTHRATHSNPNMTQVPKVGSPYGLECRSLFLAPRGYRLVGADASGLELRCLAHFMAKYDDGRYRDLILNGDVHTANWEAGKPWLTNRDMAKTFIYAFLYGAGDWKLGHTCRPQASEEEKNEIGRKLKAQFLKNVPALKQLSTAVEQMVTHCPRCRKIGALKCAHPDKGYFRLPTGHIVYVRKKHAALNSLLQGTGAVICKRWLYHLSKALKEDDVFQNPGTYHQNVWAHDEIQASVMDSDNMPEQFGAIAVAQFPKIEQELNFRCALAGEYKVGQTWADTH